MTREKDQRARFVAILGSVVVVLLFAVIVQGVRTNAESQQTKGVRIELGEDGFAPAEVKHLPDIFTITVENKTSSADYTLRIMGADGTMMNQAKVKKGTTAWTVNLPVGNYTLVIVEHPKWTCRLVVQ